VGLVSDPGTFPRFRPAPAGDARRAAASDNIRWYLDVLRSAPATLRPASRHRQLKELIWDVSEADGKYNLRFRSCGALKPGAPLQHEHVTELDTVARELLAHPERVDKILEGVVSCVVTKSEHARLGRVSRADPRLDGWDRYRAAGVAVLDTASGAWLIPPATI
jgi:hypothetical protein